MENIIRPVVHNRFDIEVADAVTGEIKQRITSYNIVLDQYFSRLIGRSSKIGYIHLGTGEGTPAVNRTSMFTFLGAKGNSVVETVKAYPTSYTRRKIVLSPSDYVGARITEVGFGYSTSSGSAVTHSMLKDSEGNQIAIEKTDTDVLTIYATFYLTIGEAVSGVYVLPTPNNNAIISAVLEDSYTTLTLTLGAHNSLVLADDLASNSISNKTNISPTSDLANRKWQIPITRWNYSEANSHMVSSIGSSTVAAWLLPNTDIFPQIALTNLSVGVGDGVETEFTCPIPKIVPGSESVRVNGVLMTRDVDYTIDNNNNAVEYPELFISTDPQNYVFSGGYNAGSNRYSFFKWNAVNSNPSVGVSNANPIYLDFGSAITINRLIIPTGTFSQNFSSTGSPTTVITFDYSLDGENWSNAFTSQDISGNSINANLWFDPVITARYFRLTSSFSVGYGAGKNPNILFGYITPGLVFMTPPAAGASIEMDCAVDRPIKNENWVLDFSFAVQFERGLMPMILTFEYTESIGSGHSPQVVHMMDNGFRILYVDDSGLVKGIVSFPELGLYGDLSWETKGRMSPDESIAYPSLKKIAHYGAFGFWSARTEHRFVMYMLPTDVSETLIDGTINHTKDSPVSSASFNLQNVNGYLLRRYRSLVSPNAMLELYFSMGTADEISLGKWYIDRVSTAIPGNNLSVTARNTIGKLLKEQTFDETAAYTETTLSDNLRAILSYAGVESFFVGDAGKSWKLSFEAQDTLLGGIEDIIRLLPGWKVEETADGVVGIGHFTDARFDQPTTYQFERDKNCWSYASEYSDENTYARVCILCKEPEYTLYVDLDPHKLWPIPEHRTLYITVPDGTTAAEMESYAAELAERIALSGRVETFAGRFTPQMVIGDAVAMVDGDISEYLGTVTNVKHTMGSKGFYTEFTVDSGGRKGKPMLKDYVAQLSGSKTSKSIITNES